MKNFKAIAIILGVLLIGGTLYMFSQSGQDSFTSLNLGALNFFHPNAERGMNQNKNSFSAGDGAGSILTETYTDSVYGFSFRYPHDYTVSSFPEGENGYIVLLQKPNARESMQIFVSPFDETGLITAERVHEDLPDMKIEEPEQVLIGEKKINALIFYLSMLKG